ncbi:MAG: aminopeptidase P N-terminal domain-containing protein [Planctomycetota bacterium]|jgi:Xaa-Pro aminopeptidase
MPIDAIPAAEYESRREKVLAALRNAVGMVFAGRGNQGLDGISRPHPHFEYLTGISDEPGAVLVLDPTHPVEARREMLFLAPLNRERERWDGYRPEIDEQLRERSGFQSIYRTDTLSRLLTASVVRAKRAACLHPLAQYDRPLSPDLEVFRKLQQRIPGLSVEDRSEVLARMRMVKSRNEVALIQRAIDITAGGFEQMMRTLKPGMGEFDVKTTIEHAYRTQGSREDAFPTIAGSGLNSTVLHYLANDQTLADGDLICVDSGAVWSSYRADITRTVPVNGKFTPRQREVYEVVLKAELAAIKAVKPGARLAAIDKAARRVITQAGFGDAFIHSIGHHLGLETHDIGLEEPLKVGAVVTIEPGIYLPDEKIGIRIEDDVLVTREGSRVLSSKIPKTVSALEKVIGG